MGWRLASPGGATVAAALMAAAGAAWAQTADLNISPKRLVLDLAENYRPPEGGKDIYAGGKPLLAALEIGVQHLQWAGYATEYDGVVARQLARVLSGGELSAPQWVSEEYLLKLELQAFLSLLHNQQTLDRVQALLSTGKPLSN